MRWNGFARSLLFAAVAAGAFPVFALFANPILGRVSALSLYLIGIAVLYVAGLTPHRSRSIGDHALTGVDDELLRQVVELRQHPELQPSSLVS